MSQSPDSPLVGAFIPSPNFEPRREGRAPDTLILHYTGMELCSEARDWLVSEESKVSAHYLVDEGGHVTQMVAESERAWHAGQSYWAGETDLNSASIGIEICNPGHDHGYPPFPDIQMHAVEALCQDIVARHAILKERVLAHSDIAPGRKCDPGERFDWARLARAGVGLWSEPVALGDDVGLGLGDENAAVAALQQGLSAYGYGVEPTSSYGKGTEIVVEAFQRHFRPARVDGRADHSTRETLRQLFALRSDLSA